MLPTNYTSDVKQSVYIHVDTTCSVSMQLVNALVFVHIICYKEEDIFYTCIYERVRNIIVGHP